LLDQDINAILYSGFKVKTGKTNKRIVISFLGEIEEYYAFLKKFDQLNAVNQKGCSASLQRKFNEASLSFLKKAFCFEKHFSLASNRRMQAFFRERVGKYLLKSKMLKRYWEKPRGYPGDYLMFEMLYRNKATSRGVGFYFDRFVVKYSLSRSVINRKNFMIKLLCDELLSSKGNAYKVLNIGCGSSRELFELFSSKKMRKRIHLTLCDQDEEALEFSRKRLSKVPGLDVETVRIDVADLVRNAPLLNLKKFDLIYSLGVVDYFRDNMLMNFAKYGLSRLKRGGKLIFAVCGNRHPEIYTPLTWFADWNFFVRDLQRTIDVLEKSGINNIVKSWEDNHNIFFLTLSKGSNK